MKKKTIALDKKLMLVKNKIADLGNLSKFQGGGDPPYQSLQCPSMVNCSAAGACDPGGSAGCQSKFQCGGDTTPGVNKCVLVEMPSFRVVCPPTPVTTNCTFALHGCAIGN